MQHQFKHFLVTGANGFIGNRFIKHLKSLNYTVTAIIRNTPLSQNNSPNLAKNHSLFNQVIIHDFNQPNNLLALKQSVQNLPDKNFDAIIHLANIAHTNNNTSLTDYWYNNVLSTLDLLDLALLTKAKSMVYLSSVKAECYSHPTTSDFYGLTKYMAEELLLHKLQNPIYKNINLSILRPSLVYGPDVKGYLKLLIKIAKKYSLPNLIKTDNKISMVHVDDVITAILLACQNTAAHGKIFTVSDNTPYSTKQIFDHIKKQTAEQHSQIFNLLAKIPIPYCLLIILAKLVDLLQTFLPSKIANKLFFNSIILNKLFGSSYFPSEKTQLCLNWQPKYTFFDSKF